MAHLESSRLQHMHRYWCAANYLTIGQIYLQGNPLLREPLQSEHIKPRLLGHWGASPGLSFIYVHLNRLIQDMVVRNEMSHFHLCLEALRRSAYPQAGPLMAWCQDMLARHQTYTREHFEDMPEVRDWVWTDM